MKNSEGVIKKNGKVKWFSPEKGFGFIICDDGSEFFVHHRDIVADGFKTLLKGQEVEFDIFSGERGEQATNIKLI